jgi:hypothetical protein
MAEWRCNSKHSRLQVISGQFNAPVPLLPGEAPYAHWIGGWVGPVTGLRVKSKRRIRPPARNRIPVIQLVTNHYAVSAAQVSIRPTGSYMFQYILGFPVFGKTRWRASLYCALDHVTRTPIIRKAMICFFVSALIPKAKIKEKFDCIYKFRIGTIRSQTSGTHIL